MHALGIETGADLRAWPLLDLEAEFGKSARWYHDIARGVDERPVRVSRTRKSIGGERTFGQNLVDRSAMLEVLQALLDDVFCSLEARDLVASTVTVKVRFPDFETLTRSYSQNLCSLSPQAVRRVLPFLLERALGERLNPQVRLLGVALSGLSSRDDGQPQQLGFDDL